MEVVGGRLSFKSQIDDYTNRGCALDDMCFVDFIVNTYERRGEETDHTPRNERILYKEGSMKHSNRYRVRRNEFHEMLPHFVGKWIPRNDKPDRFDLYAATILALFQPYQSISTLKDESETWQQAFNRFIFSASARVKAILSNFQYYYDARDKAATNSHYHPADRTFSKAGELDAETDYRLQMKHACVNHDAIYNAATELDLRVAIEKMLPLRERVHGQKAVQIAYIHGIFSKEQSKSWLLDVRQVKPAPLTIIEQNVTWQRILKEYQRLHGDGLTNVLGTEMEESGVNGDNGNLQASPIVSEGTANVQLLLYRKTAPLAGPEIECLNAEQRKAVDIVDMHLVETLQGSRPNQLLMFVTGEGGTGKSKIISTLTWIFAQRGCSAKLARTASTGVAASHIDGCTLHTFAALPIQLPSDKDFVVRTRNNDTVNRRMRHMDGVEYVIIDEVSMITQDQLWMFSNVAGQTKNAGEQGIAPTKAFGGLNVLLFGDFHQIPPVTGLPLYSQKTRSNYSTCGRGIFKQFETVVILKEQVRVRDPGWVAILRRARTGSCTEQDLNEIRSLILGRGSREKPDFTRPPWSNAALITPRHGVREEWNKQEIRRVCASKGAVLFVSPSEDYFQDDKSQLSPGQKIALLPKSTNSKGPKLAPSIEMAEGMEVMVTWNLSPDAQLANGSRGTIERIYLDPREPAYSASESIVYLKYPPAVIIFRPAHTDMPKLPGLEEGLVALQPSIGNMHLKNGNDSLLVKRKQHALTPAYSFTDYKAQGQTLEHVLVDIGKTPGGGISPFNAYVALSRSRGRDNIRLIRDFENHLFTKHPSKELEVEDARLEELDRRTTDAYLDRKARISR